MSTLPFKMATKDYVNGNSDHFRTPITRYYIDIRPYAPLNPDKALKSTPASRAVELLPLIHTLPTERQELIKKFVRKPDRYMSLSSELLKFFFIHKTARIPWSDIKISRTPKPHNRPYWAPPEGWWRRGFEGVEFNVSHQAGMIVLVGCRTPNRSRDARISDQHEISIRSPSVMNPDPTVVVEAESEIDEDESEDVRIGVDIACTWEPPRTQDLSTREKLEEWVDIFGEMFSEVEQEDMKHANAVNGLNNIPEQEWKARRFYTYWALKEAYIKMVGEGLLAPWLRQLEFRDVPVPCRPESAGHDRGAWTMLSDEAVRKLQVLFNRRNIEHTMRTALEGFEETFVVATMTRGVLDQPDSKVRWQRLDFSEIEPCATGTCQCL